MERQDQVLSETRRLSRYRNTGRWRGSPEGDGGERSPQRSKIPVQSPGKVGGSPAPISAPAVGVALLLERGHPFKAGLSEAQPFLALRFPRSAPNRNPILSTSARCLPGCGFRGSFLTGQGVAVKTRILGTRGLGPKPASRRERRGLQLAQRLGPRGGRAKPG